MLGDMLIGAVATTALTIPGTIWVLRRNELVRRLENLAGDIRTMEEIGIRYWQLDGHAAECQGFETRIKLYSFRIGSEISSLNNEFFSFRYSEHFPTFAFRQSITSHPFEERGRLADPAREERIKLAASELLRQLRLAHKLI